jgi:uncharacterized membrane protein (DUF106 family)
MASVIATYAIDEKKLKRIIQNYQDEIEKSYKIQEEKSLKA